MTLFSRVLLALVLSMGSVSTVLADEHTDLGDLTGPGVQLKLADHSIAGSIHGFTVFGNKSFNQSFLLMKRDGQLVQSFFATTGGLFGGIIQTDVEGVRVSTDIRISAVRQDLKEIHYTVNGRPVIVKISAEKFENAHFYNPTYTIIDGDKTLTLQLTNGVACYNFSGHLMSMVLGAYLHGMTL